VRIGVVENLILHAGESGAGLVLAHPVHDAAIGVRRDLVVQFQHEVVVLAGVMMSPADLSTRHSEPPTTCQPAETSVS